MLLGNPPMKTSMSFSEFGTIVGHKTANSWNLLITVATEKYRFCLFKPAGEANSAFLTSEIERLAAHKLFVATFSATEGSLVLCFYCIVIYAYVKQLVLPELRKHYQQLIS
ncbi:hypothetical protein Tco_1053202 [Tanacetum coccineum]